MSTKITVNGVEYESVDAMPPDVRKVYDETMAKIAELSGRAGEGKTEVLEGQFGPVKYMTTIQKRVVVNGSTYENVESMPPNVRQAYELGMRAAHEGDPTVKKNEIRMSFQLEGPHFTIKKTLGGSSPQTGTQPGGLASPEPTPAMPRPIEPVPAENGVRMVLIVTACAVICLALWFVARVH